MCYCLQCLLLVFMVLNATSRLMNLSLVKALQELEDKLEVKNYASKSNCFNKNIQIRN